jgi:hypothetical protein
MADGRLASPENLQSRLQQVFDNHPLSEGPAAVLAGLGGAARLGLAQRGLGRSLKFLLQARPQLP